MFFKISLENTCVGVSFEKGWAFRPATLLKRDSNEGALWNLLLFIISNSNNLYKDFSAMSITYNKSLITYISHHGHRAMTNKFENTFTYQKPVPIERLNTKNFAALLHFWIT